MSHLLIRRKRKKRKRREKKKEEGERKIGIPIGSPLSLLSLGSMVIHTLFLKEGRRAWEKKEKKKKEKKRNKGTEPRSYDLPNLLLSSLGGEGERKREDEKGKEKKGEGRRRE